MTNEELIQLRDNRMEEMTFSYSSASTFDTCPHAYRLSYLERKRRINNFYAQYGTFIHDCMELYFKKQIDLWDLPYFYLDNFEKKVFLPAPWYAKHLKEKYREDGLNLFMYFKFDREKYDILFVEKRVKHTINNEFTFIGVPDLVLKEKETGKQILFDYKTSNVFKENKKTGKLYLDKQKVSEYWNQMFIYTHVLREAQNIPIDEISLWFVRYNETVTVPWEKEREDEAIEWLLTTIRKIHEEKEFPANNTDQFFCNNLCGVREHCKFRKI